MLYQALLLKLKLVGVLFHEEVENGGADSAVVYDDTNRTLKAQAAAEPAEDALTEAQTVMPTIKVTATVDATYQIMR